MQKVTGIAQDVREKNRQNQDFPEQVQKLEEKVQEVREEFIGRIQEIDQRFNEEMCKIIDGLKNRRIRSAKKDLLLLISSPSLGKTMKLTTFDEQTP